MTRPVFVLTYLALVVLPRLAAAQAPVSAADPEGIASVIREMGFQARMDTDSSGDPEIRSSANGSEFQIQFYGCTEHRECKTLRIYSGYDLRDGTTLEVANQWNRDKRFASVYLDDDNDPFLQMDINTEGGVSRASLETSIKNWQSLKGEFEQRVGFRP